MNSRINLDQYPASDIQSNRRSGCINITLTNIYQQPRLVRLGDIRDFTLAPSPGNFESGFPSGFGGEQP